MSRNRGIHRCGRLLAVCVVIGAFCAGTASAMPPPKKDLLEIAVDALPFTIHKNIPYGPPVGRAHLLDIYVPKSAAGPLPLLVYNLGSAFSLDTTKDFDPLSALARPEQTLDPATRSALAPLLGGLLPHLDPANPPLAFTPPLALALEAAAAKANYVVAGINVRTSAQAPFPATVNDMKAAVRWLRAHAAEYGIDPMNVAVMGESSGAYTASMAGATGDSREPLLEGDAEFPGISSAVQAVVAAYGNSRISSQGQEIENNGSSGRAAPRDANAPNSVESKELGCAIPRCPSALLAESDPATHITAASPPYLLLHGTADPLVPWQQSDYLFQAIAGKCGTAEIYLVEDNSHDSKYLYGAPSGPAKYRSTRSCSSTEPDTVKAPTWSIVFEFLQRHLRNR